MNPTASSWRQPGPLPNGSGRSPWTALVGSLLSALTLWGQTDRDAFFENRIRPVLTEQCHDCHSARAERVRGGLRVDSRAALIEGGDSGPAVVPGDPEHSRLIEAVRGTDPDHAMPPPRRGDRAFDPRPSPTSSNGSARGPHFLRPPPAW